MTAAAQLQQLQLGGDFKEVLGGGSPRPCLHTAVTLGRSVAPRKVQEVQERRYIPTSPLRLQATVSPSPCAVFLLQQQRLNLLMNARQIPTTHVHAQPFLLPV